MGEIIDLSREITDGIAVYPGDDPVKLYQTKFLAEDKYNNHRLETGMHVGTHIDAPMHMTAHNTCVSDIKLDYLIGKGCVIRVEPAEVIDYRREYEDKIAENSIVLVHTGFCRLFGTERYFTKHPVLSLEFGKMLIRKNVKALGLDTPSPDKYPFKLHQLLLSHGILIVENLTNLDELPADRFEVFVIPPKIRADGSMARVFARAY